MELIIIVLIGWVLSNLSRATKKTRQQQAAGRDAPRTPEASRPAPEQRPMRPRDVDLPGQTTMPIHWEGTAAETPRTIPEPDAALRMFYNESPLTDYDAGAGRSDNAPSKKQRDDSAPVTIPGLNLAIDGDALVKGVIFSEILNRRPVRRTR